eukprot:tig00020675_g12691.t1
MMGTARGAGAAVGQTSTGKRPAAAEPRGAPVQLPGILAHDQLVLVRLAERSSTATGGAAPTGAGEHTQRAKRPRRESEAACGFGVREVGQITFDLCKTLRDAAAASSLLADPALANAASGEAPIIALPASQLSASCVDRIAALCEAHGTPAFEDLLAAEAEESVWELTEAASFLQCDSVLAACGRALRGRIWWRSGAGSTLTAEHMPSIKSGAGATLTDTDMAALVEALQAPFGHVGRLLGVVLRAFGTLGRPPIPTPMSTSGSTATSSGSAGSISAAGARCAVDDLLSPLVNGSLLKNWVDPALGAIGSDVAFAMLGERAAAFAASARAAEAAAAPAGASVAQQIPAAASAAAATVQQHLEALWGAAPIRFVVDGAAADIEARRRPLFIP